MPTLAGRVLGSSNSVVDIAVIGAGAAGLGAAKTLGQAGADFILLEASHRIGGRAYTEEAAPGVPFDLGCHWMHSGSLNPFVPIAERLGFTYSTEAITRRVHDGRDLVSEAEQAACMAFLDQCFAAVDAAAAAGQDVAIADVTARENRWTPFFDYLVSLFCSVDSDQVSTVDLYAYNDTHEDWPLKEGYGTLIARFGADQPVELNTAVTRIDWSGPGVTLETAQGTVRAKTAIITVSTGILGGGDIRFAPDLPDWKQAAIAALPLGNHNRICLLLDRDVFGPDALQGVTAMPADEVPMSFRIRPFGYDYVVAVTGGRFADWLERAGIEASADLAKERLASIYGNAIKDRVVRSTVTAWRGDPWVRGAYSASQPGQGQRRADLAKPVGERLFFAGEATSTDFFSTAHGAYLSGIDAAKAALARLADVKVAAR